MSEVTVADRPVTDSLVTVFGGSGFLGRYVVRALARRGYRIRVAVRRPDLANFLLPYGYVGQIQLVQANVRFADSVRRAVQGSDFVVNLVGVLAARGRQSFDAVHVYGARAIATSAAEMGARVVHVSAIGADSTAAAAYARTKGLGEEAVRAAVPDCIILRPSLLFGPEDDFFNRFAAMTRFAFALPLIGGGKTRFQPVFVADVAAAVERAVDGKAKSATIYELGGPEVRTFRELMELLLREIGSHRILMDLPFGVADLMARVLGWVPGGSALLTRDQVAMLHFDNVVSDAAIAEHRTIQDLGILPAAMASVLPSYLWRFRKAGQFTRIET